MIYNTYDRLIIRHSEKSSRTIVDSDDDYDDDENPIFGRINGSTRCVISLHVTPTDKSRKSRYGTETQYLLQGKCKVFRKKTTRLCLDCADTDAVRK